MDQERIVEILQILERESQIVRNNNLRAERLNLPATLTLEEWIHVLAHYDWKCFYCGGHYEVLEHYIPLEAGGMKGTEKYNCLPACMGCNISKGSRQPLEWEEYLVEKKLAQQEKELAHKRKLQAQTDAYYARHPQPIQTHLEDIQEHLEISPLALTVACHMSLPRYVKAERGFPCTQETAARILETVNMLLIEVGKPEVILEDLGLNLL